MPGLRAKKQKGRLRDLSVMGWWYLFSDGKAISPACHPSLLSGITGHFRIVSRHPGK
jgi:hypothetical protein